MNLVQAAQEATTIDELGELAQFIELRNKVVQMAADSPTWEGKDMPRTQTRTLRGSEL